MKRISSKLKQEVTQEAKNIRKYATKDERARLDFERLIPQSPRRCIYGQMTGTCRSSRAIQLLSKCALPYWSFKTSRKLPEAKRKNTSYGESDIYFSPIESYIMQPKADNKALIAFIKGETDTLSLNTGK